MLRRLGKPSTSLDRVDPAIAAAVRGGDSLLGWKAVWDLAQSTDVDHRQRVLEALRAHVRTGPAAQCERARAFAAALAEVPGPAAPAGSPTCDGLSAAELRRRRERVQIDENRRAMERIGIRPGEGIPMWAMYMTRRNKRTWSL